MAIQTTPQTQAVTNNIWRLMGRVRMSQLALSNQSGIPLSTLRRRMDGVSALNLDELVAISTALGTTIVDLVSGDAEAIPA